MKSFVLGLLCGVILSTLFAWPRTTVISAATVKQGHVTVGDVDLTLGMAKADVLNRARGHFVILAWKDRQSKYDVDALFAASCSRITGKAEAPCAAV
jgi:hypothetical protein